MLGDLKVCLANFFWIGIIFIMIFDYWADDTLED
jgi:hypothetical protein